MIATNTSVSPLTISSFQHHPKDAKNIESNYLCMVVFVHILEKAFIYLQKLLAPCISMLEKLKKGFLSAKFAST